ncbi:hypothetical protein [Actinomadura kijaniata]|uniref:hypothetical protein n=1 Tax=Actinomadura kijaniata TaxID=46161 RepID=UPI0008325462|nr:hypothetical protein [Actinomadura kijaniata]
MAEKWVETTSEDLRRWSEERGGAVDAQGARLLLELAQEQAGLTGPGELDPATLRTLLLEVFPAVVVASAEEVPAILDTVRGLAAYLRDRDLVPADRAAALLTELDGIAPAFAEAVVAADSPERQAAAEMITGLMAADGVDLDDEAAVEEWLAAFEELPEEERVARTEDYLRRAGELAVPPVRLAPEPELAAAARASGLTAQVRAVARWAEGRAVDEHDEPSVADALAALGELGLATPRRAADVADLGGLPELERLWWAALEAEVITTSGGRAQAGPGLAALDGDDAAALETWLKLFDAAVVPEHEGEDGLDPTQLVQNELTGVLIRLYEQDGPSAPEELAEALTAHIADSYELAEPAAIAATVAAGLELELADLTAWGVVEGVPDGLVLTPLGVWGVRELLRADGFLAPVVGDLADAPAADLVAGLVWHREDTADEEIGRWLAARPAADAADGLLAVIAEGGPGRRNLAAAVLGRLGPEAEPRVRAAADGQPVRPYALLWLAERGLAADEPSRDDYLWMFVDTVAGMLETAEPREAVAAALLRAPAEADMVAFAEELWRSEHPDTARVLEALGAHHPDRTVAKAARTAAHKARSVRGRG